MLYEFRDINEVSEGATLPSEALNINGVYIEEEIQGYRTLNVSGRESLSCDLETFDSGSRDGARLKYKRYPERIITVTYQLIADTSESFREKYNQLGRILNTTNAVLIFADEDDKYFIGTPQKMNEVKPGSNNVVGSFEICCLDPFKYSLLEYSAEASLDDQSILINYAGSHVAYPILEANIYTERDTSEDGEELTALTRAGDCSFVSFFNEEGKIIQLGDPEEVDGVALPDIQTLISSGFDKAQSWGTAAKQQWIENSNAETIHSCSLTGSVGVGVAAYIETDNKKTTSAQIFHGNADYDEPMFNYKVVAKTSGRTANSVKVNISITAALTRRSAYFGRGYGLKASVYVQGAWYSVTLKRTHEFWRGTCGHTVNLAGYVSGLTETQDVLTGFRFKVERTDGYNGRCGILSARNCSNIPIVPYLSEEADGYYLRASNYGSGSAWHGASITRNIPADMSNDVGAADFDFTFSNKFSIGGSSDATAQCGLFQASVIGEDGSLLAGITLYKHIAGKNATLRFFIGSDIVHEAAVDISYKNKLFASNVQHKIRKTGQEIHFSVAGIKKNFKRPAVKDTKAKKIAFVFAQHGTKAPLVHNGLFWVKFLKHNCDAWEDYPNMFSKGDVIEANCRTGEIFINGELCPEVGALGNDWEDFTLKPGLNQIGFAYSSWLTDDKAPYCKVRYREVYL